MNIADAISKIVDAVTNVLEQMAELKGTVYEFRHSSYSAKEMVDHTVVTSGGSADIVEAPQFEQQEATVTERFI